MVTAYSNKADALRAELGECEAKVEEFTVSLNRGQEVVELLNQAIRQRARQRENAQSVTAKRKYVSRPRIVSMGFGAEILKVA